MLRRTLQRLVRLAPGTAESAWLALPAGVRRRLAPIVYPIAAGARRGSIRLEVPPNGARRCIDVVATLGRERDARVLLDALGSYGGRSFSIAEEVDLIAFAREHAIVDAALLGDADRSVARRLGWRVGDAGVSIEALFPTVSIVVVTHDNRDLCASCLAALDRNAPWPRIEVAVIDNGSRDGTRELLREVAVQSERTLVLESETNEGFARATNRGIRATTGTFVVFLNDDTVVAPGWLGRLVARLEDDPRLALLCPATNEISTNARIETAYLGLDEMEALAMDRGFSHAGDVRDTDIVPLFCAAGRRVDLERAGLLDERYEVGMFEDDDLAHALRAQGGTLAVAIDAFVHHVGSASFGKLSDDAYLAIWEANKRRFEKKWKTRWLPPELRGRG